MGHKFRDTGNLLDIALKSRLINSIHFKELMEVRKTRNTAVHTEQYVSEENAQKALEIYRKTIATLER